jgi:small GTP-binding protein
MTDLIRKVCICGDPNVGKTSLVRRFVTGKYDEKYISTLGTVVSKKSVRASKGKDNVTMMLWDVSGQPEFKRIHASAFKNATGGLAVCDITRPDTTNHLKDWITDFKTHAGEDVPVTILANKCDLTEEANKNLMENMEMCKELGASLFLTSAKTGENVEKAFKDLADRIVLMNNIGEGNTFDPGLPEHFGSASALFDYVVVKFCDALGDQELGMHMIRKQVSDKGINFRRVTKAQVEALIPELVDLLTQFRGRNAATDLKHHLIKAIDRCTGC